MELKKIEWMIKKDLLELWRHKVRLVSLFIFPILMIALVGWGMGGTIDNTPVIIVKQSDGDLSDQAIELIKSNKIYDIKDITSDVDEAKQAVEDGDVKAAIILPTDFDTGDEKNAILYIDSSDQTVTSSLVPTTEQLFMTLSEQLVTENIEASSDSSVLNSAAETIKLNVDRIYGDIDYIDFLMPGILGMVMFMSSMMTMGNSIAGERERGELARLFMTPTSISTVLIGKIISQVVRMMFQVFILIIGAALLFNVTVKGSYILLVVLMLISVLCFVGFGIMLSATAKTQEDYLQTTMPITMPAMFICGIFFPTETMPWILQELAYIFPLKYSADALRSVILQGGGLSSIILDIVILLLFTLVFYVVGVSRFNRDI